MPRLGHVAATLRGDRARLKNGAHQPLSQAYGRARPARDIRRGRALIEEKQLPVGELRKGMYVSRLDRPWTETPFLFQGFSISRAREIEILQDYCEFVFVDTKRSRPPEHETPEVQDPDLIAPLPRPPGERAAISRP